jgi:hypothetical protein
VDGFAPDDLAHALGEERLVVFYGARGTVMLAPPEDLPVLTIGTAPSDDGSLRAALPGAFVRHLDTARFPATDALRLVVDAVRDVLASGPKPRGETAMEVTRALPPVLTPPCRGRCPDPHVEDSLFRLAGVSGTMRFYRGDDVLVGVDPDEGRSRPSLRHEFVRRYLSCYGPSTPATLAAWAGISEADARRSIESLSDEVVPVEVDGHRAGVLLSVDAANATEAVVRTVRFLPPFDPYLLARDRSLLVPSRAIQKVVWRSSGNPGVLVADGEPLATWRTRKRAGRSDVLIEPLDPGSSVDEAAVSEERDRLTQLLDRESLTTKTTKS